MNNGKSKLIPPIDANILAAIMFFCCAAASLLNYFWGWLSPIILVVTILLFFFDSNSFVRKCSVQIIFFYLATVASSLIFGSWLSEIPLIGIAFRIIDWIIRTVTGIFALISGIQALSGNRYEVPFLGSFIDAACAKLGIF